MKNNIDLNKSFRNSVTHSDYEERNLSNDIKIVDNLYNHIDFETHSESERIVKKYDLAYKPGSKIENKLKKYEKLNSTNQCNRQKHISNTNGSVEMSYGVLLPIQKQFKENRYFVINNNVNNNYTYLSKDSSRQLNLFDSDHVTRTRIDFSIENNEVKKQNSYKYDNNNIITNFSKEKSKRNRKYDKTGLIDKKSIILNSSESILNDESIDQINGLIKNISNHVVHDDLFAKNFKKYNKNKKVSLIINSRLTLTFLSQVKIK